MTRTDIPEYDDLPTRGGLPCSWSLWPDDDVLGCLNLVTPEMVLAALASAVRGERYSLNWSVLLPSPELFDRSRARHEIVERGDGVSESLVDNWNTQASSQWDGFAHLPREGFGFFAGLDEKRHGVQHWAARGIAGRAVLADVARWRELAGHPLVLDEAQAISCDDLENTLRHQGSTVERGDFLLIRTGWTSWYETLDQNGRDRAGDRRALRAPGLEPSEAMARWLWNHHVAAVIADNPGLEVTPVGALLSTETKAEIDADRSRRHEVYLHTRILPMLGIPIGELWDLAAIANACAVDGLYSFALSSAPMNLKGGVASPANALAFK